MSYLMLKCADILSSSLWDRVQYCKSDLDPLRSRSAIRQTLDTPAYMSKVYSYPTDRFDQTMKTEAEEK